jgi:hypothetical protein
VPGRQNNVGEVQRLLTNRALAEFTARARGMMMSSLAEVRPLLPPARLDAVINAIGETRFEAELLGFLDHSFGADHLAIFGLDGERPTLLAAISYDGTGTSHERAHLYLENEHWRRDPAMSAVRQPSALDRSARACCMVCHP